ncbi:MAG: tRNA (guanine(10)-N(2))-dimethyltransferase [Nanobdellota archaeon]
MYQLIREGKTESYVPVEKKVSKRLPVFYNPVMRFNRDISVFFVKKLQPQQVSLPLAGTGIRGIRFLKETDHDMAVYMNDISEEAVKLIGKNAEHNSVSHNIVLSNKDADEFLLSMPGADYIDIDPFGSPNFFIDSAVKRLSRNGYLAVTATDTSALCGTHKRACRRKYWADSQNDHQMHETGLRILIRKVQLVAAQFDKALYPLISYSKDHYMRVFFVCRKGKKKVDELLCEHGPLNGLGPLWLGTLNDKKLLRDILEDLPEDYPDRRFLELLAEEYDTLGMKDLHILAKEKSLSELPKTDEVIRRIKDKGYNATRTHLSRTAIKTDMEDLSEVLY